MFSFTIFPILLYSSSILFLAFKSCCFSFPSLHFISSLSRSLFRLPFVNKYLKIEIWRIGFTSSKNNFHSRNQFYYLKCFAWQFLTIFPILAPPLLASFMLFVIPLFYPLHLIIFLRFSHSSTPRSFRLHPFAPRHSHFHNFYTNGTDVFLIAARKLWISSNILCTPPQVFLHLFIRGFKPFVG